MPETEQRPAVEAPANTNERGPDQSYKPFIGVKLIHAYPCFNGNLDGYNVKYADGYESWSPKAAFESAYLGLSAESSITPAEIEKFMGNVGVCRIDPKTCLVSVQHITGFMQYNTASCVDPENYNEQIGKDVAMKKIKDQLWFALGFVLQWGKYGLKK